MLFAAGWAVVRSSRDAYARAGIERLDVIDDEVRRADADLFDRLEAFLSRFRSPDLDWTFRRQLNNHRGILHLSSSRNHRSEPSAIAVLQWLAEHGPGSYGLVYIHDDEDGNHDNVFRVWRLMQGEVAELDDPFLSPIVPRIDPNEYA